MSLKSSRFNIIVPLESERTLLFNTLTSKLILLNCNNKMLDYILKNPNEEYKSKKEEIKNKLIQKKFIIDSGLDELKLIKDNYEMSRTDNSILRLTILSTLKCNFKCKYCWQSLKGKDMDTYVQSSIIKFVENNIKKYKLVDINWFGGEPLVNSRAIQYIGNNIKNICENNGVKYTSGIATNGYLLTQNNLKMLSVINTKSIVVTLDGPPEIHNKRRKLANGDDSFEQILSNIKKTSQYISHINIGVNCDYENIGYVDELLNYLEDVKPLILIYFRWIFPNSDKWAEYYTNINHISEAAKDNKEIMELNWLAIKRGFKIRNPIFTSKNAYCNTEYKNHFIIDPEGKIYKCNVEFELKKSVGYLSKDGNLNVNNDEIEKWCCGEKSLNSKCLACKLFPVCKGGCVFAYLETNKNKCVITNLDNASEYIKMKYYELKNSNKI